jgi:hypothetical protein
MNLSLDRQLPEEILDHITSFIPRHILPKLCLASKTFNRLATAHLYSTITLGHKAERDNRRVTYISSLAYLLFSSPAHAALVTSVVVSSEWGRDEDNAHLVDKYPWPGLGTTKLQRILRDQCEKFAENDNEADEIYAMIQSGTNEDAILALLLFSLPNMRRLDINFGLFDDHTDFHTLIPLLANRVRSLDNERSVPLDVIVKGEDDKYPNKPNQFTTVFHMPRIRSICGWKMGDDEGDPDLVDGPFARFKPRSHHVKSIELRESKLNKDHLRLLMEATIPGELTTFNYEIGCTWAWCVVEHPAIMESLSAHHSTLENLALSHEDFYPYQFDNDSEKPWPCSFVPFKALKRLKVAPVYIWGHEGFNHQTELKKSATKEMLWRALPENLEQLWITRAQMQEPPSAVDDTTVLFEPDCLLPAIELVVQHKTKAFPKLTHLRVELPRKEWQDEWLVTLSLLCEAASANGIQSTIILTGLSQSYKDNVECNWGWEESVEWGECYNNQEPPKMWIDAAELQDFICTSRSSKSKHAVTKGSAAPLRQLGGMASV